MNGPLSVGQWIAMVVTVLLLLAGAVWLEVYSWHDCLRVGHTTAYCLIHLFR